MAVVRPPTLPAGDPPRPPAAAAPAGAFLGLATYVVGGALIPVLQRYLSFHFDQFTQNFYRMLAGGCALLLVAGLWYRPGLRCLLGSARGLGWAGLMSLGAALGNALVVEGIARTSATVGGLMLILIAPLASVAAALLYAEERRLLRRARVLGGAGLALAGAVALALSAGQGDLRATDGVWLLLGAALVMATLTVFAKRVVTEFEPVSVTAVMTLASCVTFGVAGLRWGHLGAVLTCPPLPLAVLLLSGVYGLLVGFGLQFVTLRRLGVVTLIFGSLASPVFTALFGHWVFQERLAARQLAAAAVLLVGCLLVVAAKAASRKAQEEH